MNGGQSRRVASEPEQKRDSRKMGSVSGAVMGVSKTGPTGMHTLVSTHNFGHSMLQNYGIGMYVRSVPGCVDGSGYHLVL